MEPILVMESIWAPTLEWSEYWNGANIGGKVNISTNTGMKPTLVME